MKFNELMDYNAILGHQALLVGETNTKKTYYTAEFIKFLIKSKQINPKEITILDFAPKLTRINELKIGGQIQDFFQESNKCNNITFEGDIIPPRLNASNKKELYENACKNYDKTSRILNRFNENPTNILIINDISIYLHLGSKIYLLKTIQNAKTFFGNSYHGKSIYKNFAKLFSLKEKHSVEYLIKNIKMSFYMEKLP